MGKSKKDKKEESIFDMIEDMTGIPSEYVWVILVILFILIIVGCLYFFEIGPFDSGNEVIAQNVNTAPKYMGQVLPPAAPQPLPNLKQENVLFPPPPPSQPTPIYTGAQNSSPPYITPPTIPTDPAFPPKVTGGGIQIFKKR